MADARPTMHVKVYAPYKIYFDGTANSVSAVNLTGPFDVLPHHKNFMTLLAPCTIYVRSDGKPNFSLPITRGIMHVKADKTTVFLDI
jgi:F0F1-type ATP synthase epsilon subunit